MIHLYCIPWSCQTENFCEIFIPQWLFGFKLLSLASSSIRVTRRVGLLIYRSNQSRSSSTYDKIFPLIEALAFVHHHRNLQSKYQDIISISRWGCIGSLRMLSKKFWKRTACWKLCCRRYPTHFTNLLADNLNDEQAWSALIIFLAVSRWEANLNVYS